MRKITVIVAALLMIAFAAFGAEDPAGTWKATFDTPGGPQESTFVLKADGGTLTGTVSGGMLNTQQISEGKVDGNKVTFSISSDFGVIRYTGTIQGDDMKLTLVVGDGQFTIDINAKRVKA